MMAQLNRRALLGAIAVAPMAATSIGMIGTPAVAAPSAWPAAYAHWKALDEAWDRFITDTYNPAVDALESGAPEPPRYFTHTIESGQSIKIRVDRDEGTSWDLVRGPIGEKGRALQADHEAWQKRRSAIRQELGYDEIMAADDRWGEIVHAAKDAACAAPVASLAELMEKMTFAQSQSGGEFDRSVVDALMTDVRRLAGREH